MDLRKLKTLVDLVSESNISELEITEAEGKVRIVKGGIRSGHSWHRTCGRDAGPAAATAAMTGAVSACRLNPAAASVEPAGTVIKSPMVGTYYRAASPGAKPFAEVGQHDQGRRPGLHHRGDEDHERDRG
jgi:acetyl-CoA carboxylase biotin carboxyl carrier protein